jgi:hypothetical protein
LRYGESTVFRVREKHLQAITLALDLEVFQEKMIAHLQGFAPSTAEAAGVRGLQRCIAEGIERARIHGVTNPGLLRFFIELMVRFGHRFDTDPLYPWASAILGDASLTSQATRIGGLFQASEHYLETIGQHDHSIAIPLLRALKDVRLDRLRPGIPGFVEATLETLWTIDPRRCQHLGEGALRELIRRSPQAAADCGLDTDRGVAMVTLLSFVVGHGFATDPIYPWIESALCNPRTTDPAYRGRCLEGLAETFLTRALAHFERGSHVRL